ncbi:phosphohistidine phosphatase [Erythrobacter sp. SG61-1L]|uniref:SixA phosphatase family protein n=1 Tax=Erythrobacter sp. SG61-1L TaxID=1603897 RepID=UPI0006C90F82|nr:histidine phosphatase family protein [Erythrobacter sp. SG61-1L]KPL67132.1 phosphohistidine phosphatase [Erythrobacter sp. SG61-1L]
MKLLGLLRHAKSDWDDLGLRDFDRGLNNRGRKGAALMGQHIRDHGIRWEQVLASPAERVKRTLEAAGIDGHVNWQDRAYLASSSTLIELLRAVEGSPDSVLLAGHNPGLQELIFDLVPPDAENALFDAAAEKYPTATFAVLELDIADWAELEPNCGRLIHLARPRDLDPELGPEGRG